MQFASSFIGINNYQDITIDKSEQFMGFSVDGHSFYTIDSDRVVRTRNFENLQLLTQTELAVPDENTLTTWSYNMPNEWVISPDGKWIRNSIWETPSAIWKLPDGTFFGNDHCRTCNGVYSPESNYYVASNGVYQVTEEGDQLVYSGDFANYFSLIVISPDSRYFAVNNGPLRIFELETGEIKCEINLPEYHNLEGIAFSPGNHLLAYSDEDAIYILDTGSQEIIYSFKAHFDDIISLAFSPDGTLLASKAFDGSIRFWGIPPG